MSPYVPKYLSLCWMVNYLNMVDAAAELKVFELELEFELHQNVPRFTHFLHTIRHFVFVFLEHDS